ncbi:uncharacterized protein [Mytilus edulis]|uniref:uncharacterized protein isoform X2 n=1 Tax=Mytilus edulis TaxID=6550 RepID=UPI0039F0B60C
MTTKTQAKILTKTNFLNAVHVVNGKPFGKVRKVKKQVLMDQYLDNLECKPSKQAAKEITNGTDGIQPNGHLKVQKRTGENLRHDNDDSENQSKQRNRSMQNGFTVLKTGMITTENNNEEFITIYDAKRQQQNASTSNAILDNTVNGIHGRIKNRKVRRDSNVNPIRKTSFLLMEDTVNGMHGQQEVRRDSKGNPIRKTSALLSEDTGRPGRRDSVVAMSTRRYSLSPSVSKSKVRKTSFVAPPTATRRKSLQVNGIIKNKLSKRTNTTQLPEAAVRRETKQITLDVLIQHCDESSSLSVDVETIASSLSALYPSFDIEINGAEGMCLYSKNNSKNNKGNNKSTMAPRDELHSTVYNEKFSIKDVIKEMKQKPNNSKCQTDFCRRMAAFANDDSLHVLLAKQEGISCIIKAMKQFTDIKDLIKSACQTLLKMTSYSDANCVHVHKEDGISFLIELVQLKIDDAELLQTILDILGYLVMTDDTDIIDSMIDKSCHTIILTTMSRHGDNSDIVKQCCFILSNLVNSVDIARSLMFIGGVHVIIGAMQKFEDNNEVLENGCRALGSFAVHDEICTDVVNAGALTITLHTLERSREDERLLECATWALACLTKYEESCTDVCNSCGMEKLIQGMKNFSTIEIIQEYGCWTICNVIAHDKPFDVNISHDIVHVLLDATSMFLDNIDLQEQLLFAISETIIVAETILHRFVSSKGIPLIVKTMTQYPDHCPIQEHGCRIIGNVAVYEQHRLHIETEGGSKVIVSAMLTLETSEELQEIGCLALTNITANVYKNKVTAVKSGCVSAVLKAITAESDNNLLSALQTIGNVIEIDDACYNFLEENGIQIIRTVLCTKKLSPDSTNILLFASNILSRISFLLGIDEGYIGQAEKLLLEIKDMTDENSEAVLSLSRFYENMLKTEKRYSLFREKNIKLNIYKWINEFEDDSNIQISCCKVLAAVALYDKDLSIEVFNVMKKCMTAYVDNSDIQLICCGAIVYISDNNEACRDCLVQKGAVKLAINAIKTHTTVEKLVDVCLMALDTLLVKIPEHVEYGVKDHMLLHIMEVIRLYPENTEIQIHGCNIVSKLQKEHKDIFCNGEAQDTCDHLVRLLRRRRSNSELQAAAVEALKSLLPGESEYVQNTKEQLTFLTNCWFSDLNTVSS